jgi:hypothetical protein
MSWLIKRKEATKRRVLYEEPLVALCRNDDASALRNSGRRPIKQKKIREGKGF